ncbi:MAG TPA: PilN domain-containing protein [bacterium]|nr:PilN domain-containing protein [bacterium]
MIRINLLPHESRKSVRRSGGGGAVFNRTKVIPLGALGVMGTVCLVVFMLQSARQKSLEKEVAVAKAEAEKYLKTIALIDEMVAKETELNRRLDIVRTLDQNRYRTVTVLDEMAKRVPSYLWLTTVKEVSPDRLAIDGLAFSNLVVSDLMLNLEKSDVFQDVELSVAKRKEIEEQHVVGFTLTTTVNGKNAALGPLKNVQGTPAVGASDTPPTIRIPAAAPADVVSPSGESVGG